MRHAILIATIAATLIGTGCAPSTGQQTSAATPASSGGQSVTLPSQNGQSITVSSQVPDELKGFPVPDGFTLDKNGYGSISSKDGALAVGSWSGTATPQVVFDFYSKTMPQQGWTEQLTSKTDSGALLTYSKGDNGATVTITTSDKTTKISVMMGKSVATPTVASSASTSGGTSTAAQSVATNTPAPPSLSATGAVPAALKDVPVPTGFKVVADSAATVSAGGKVSVASVRWFGTASVADVAAFYKKAMAAGWTEVTFVQTDEGFVAAYTSMKDPKIGLGITASKTDAGTEVAAILNVSQ